MKEELLKGLTEEQVARIKSCKNSDEVLSLVKKEGIELTDEQLEAVSGGSCEGDVTNTPKVCPNCGSPFDVKVVGDHYHCSACNTDFGHRKIEN